MSDILPVFLVGTYHKTGTVWMLHVFRRIARYLDLPFVTRAEAGCNKHMKAGIIFDPHSAFTDQQIQSARGGLRLIRDPRDIIVSSAFYHIRSDEKWLLKPQETLGGKSYRQYMLDLPSDEDRFIFELCRGTANKTISDIVKHHDRVKNHPFLSAVKYENLMQDLEGRLFLKTVEGLDLGPYRRWRVKRLFLRHSIFGGNRVMQHHVRSGKPQQWKALFTPKVANAFLETHGDCLIKLGYEGDNDWLEKLRE